jgi:carboxyl-terminal processing protease
MTIRFGQIIKRGIGAAAVLGLAFVGGIGYQDLRAMPLGQSPAAMLNQLGVDMQSDLLTAARGQTDEYSPYEMYADVLETLRTNYYGKPVDTTKITYSAISGMMGACHDKYTFFLTPTDYKSMMDENEGDFVGIGAVLGTNPQNQVYVVKVLPASPAMKAKVQMGDVIIKVNGKSTRNMLDTDVVGLIHGQENTRVVLTMLRKGVSHPIAIPIIREVVESPVVQYAMVDPINKIGYISMASFNEESDVQLGKAMTALQAQGMRGIIFDLRENPGGLLDVAREVASRFLPAGPVLWTRDRGETLATMQPINVDTSQHRNELKYPLVLLVNGDSASAAEIVSGAIKDRGAGILVGEKTYGKGVVQEIEPLPDGSAARITIEHYYTAGKHDINLKGIEPNIVVHYSDATQRKMFAYQKGHPNALYDLPYDTQLQRALIVERQQMRVASARPW